MSYSTQGSQKNRTARFYGTVHLEAPTQGLLVFTFMPKETHPKAEAVASSQDPGCGARPRQQGTRRAGIRDGWVLDRSCNPCSGFRSG